MYVEECGKSMHEYRLYYAGFDKTTGVEQIGLAISDDLIRWRRPLPGPIVSLASTGYADAVQTSNPCVLKRPEGYRMWYQGRNTEGQISICHAVSDDGISWVFGDAPVLAVAPEARGNRVGYHHPHVLFDTDRATYCLWCTRYENDSSHFLYAESADGIRWSVKAEKALAPEKEWEGKQIFYPCVLADGDSLTAWYSGIRSKKEWQIGRALSRDGIEWIREPDRAVLPERLQSKPERFIHEQLARLGIYTRRGLSAFGTASPNVWKEGGRYHMLAHDVGPQSKLSIGHYVSQDGIIWQQIGWDILAEGRGGWDSFFQGDPFLLIV